MLTANCVITECSSACYSDNPFYRIRTTLFILLGQPFLPRTLFFPKQGEWHWLGWAADAWFWVDHAHIMSVWGVVYDDVTSNAFYLLDTPIATLDQIQVGVVN